jgi:hypothetical protein
MMQAEQYNRLSTLTDAESRAVLRHHLKLLTPEDEPSTPLLLRLVSASRMDHSTLLRGVFRTTDPTLLHAMETIVGRPITRIQRPTVHAPTRRLTRPPRPRAKDDRVIHDIQPNPKKVGSASYERFALYRDGMTVSEALAAGITTADMKWDSERGYVVIG